VHLAWESAGDPPALLLLATSMGVTGSLDAVVRVTFDPGFTAIATATAVMATPACMNHRVLAAPSGWYVSELGACQLAHVSTGWTGSGPQAVDEAADYFSGFGMGTPAEKVAYAAPFAK
jgi:virginiamycin B lyase